MPPLPLSQLLELAQIIFDEEQDGANTAERVGGMLLSLIRSATMPFDAGAEYESGQYVLFGDYVYRALQNTAVSESPSLAPAKWRVLGGKSLLQLLQAASVSTTGHPSEVPAILTILIDGIFGENRTKLISKLALRLADLSEFTAYSSLTLTDVYNYFTLKPFNQPLTDRGWVHYEETSPGVKEIMATMAYTTLRRLALSLGPGKEQIAITPDVIILNSPGVDASGASLTVRTSGRTILPAADPDREITNFLVSQPIPTGGYRDVFVGRSALVRQLFPDLLPLLQPYLNTSGGSSGPAKDNWIVEEVCEYIEVVPPPPYQNITQLTPYNGQLIEHNMQTDQLWVTASNNPIVSYFFPDPDHVGIRIPEDVVIPSLTFKLEPLNG